MAAFSRNRCCRPTTTQLQSCPIGRIRPTRGGNVPPLHPWTQLEEAQRAQTTASPPIVAPRDLCKIGDIRRRKRSARYNKTRAAGSGLWYGFFTTSDVSTALNWSQPSIGLPDNVPQVFAARPSGRGPTTKLRSAPVVATVQSALVSKASLILF